MRRSRTLSDPALPNWIDRIEQWSRILIPFLIAGVGYFVQASLATQNVNSVYVTAGVGVLTVEQGKVDAQLREWATDVLSAGRFVAFAPKLQEKLQAGTAAFPTISVRATGAGYGSGGYGAGGYGQSSTPAPTGAAP